jgi:GNAT superfamily N-acetyltransferase
MISIRPARPEEAPALTAMALRSKAHWGYEAGFMSACIPELTVTPDGVRRHPTHVAVEDDRPVGFYLLEPIVGGDLARFGDGGVELVFLFVEPEFIGRGCGAILVRHAQETARALGFAALVIQGDPHAAGFYEAMGAVQVGTRESGVAPGRRLPVYRIDLV